MNVGRVFFATAFVVCYSAMFAAMWNDHPAAATLAGTLGLSCVFYAIDKDDS